MIRESTDADAAHVLLGVKPDGGIEFMTRYEAGSPTIFIAAALMTFPLWLKLQREGQVVSGYVSADGSRWTTVGTTPFVPAVGPLVGLAVTSHDTASVNAARFESLSRRSGASASGYLTTVPVGGDGGVGTVVGAQARSALSTFRRPLVPTEPESAVSTSTLLRSVALSVAVSSAHFARMSAADPDTCGVAIDVPLKYRYVLPMVVDRMLTPGAREMHRRSEIGERRELIGVVGRRHGDDVRRRSSWLDRTA